MTKSILYLGKTKVEVDITPKKMKSGKNGYFANVETSVDGKNMRVQILAYPVKEKKK